MPNPFEKCNICPRKCGVNRLAGERGICKMPAEMHIARAALHMWEEPSVSGSRGSGAIFFSGCNLGCIYCQNREISRGEAGVPVTPLRLAEIMLNLEKGGAHNINLVTPTHFAPSIISAVKIAKNRGLSIPIVYNTSSYESEQTLESLRGTVDIFLPDLKYYKSETAVRYSKAKDLPEISRLAIEKMVEIAGNPTFDNEGIMRKGVIVRILLLPSHLAEAKLNLKYLHGAFGDKIYISLMSQYTPMKDMPKPLNRRVTAAEYRELVDYAVALGVKNAYIQDIGSAEESFIPPFDLTGV